MHEDSGPILRARVGTLAVERRGVVEREEDLEQPAVRNRVGVECDLYRFRMPCGTGTYRFVRRPWYGATGIARDHPFDALQALEDRLETPEASPGYGSYITARHTLGI